MNPNFRKRPEKLRDDELLTGLPARIDRSQLDPTPTPVPPTPTPSPTATPGSTCKPVCITENKIYGCDDIIDSRDCCVEHPDSNSYIINFGNITGVVGITYEAGFIPDLFVLKWNGFSYSSGFVGDCFPTSCGAFAGCLGGAPVVDQGSGNLFFNKTLVNPTTALLTVHSSCDDTQWKATPVCDSALFPTHTPRPTLPPTPTPTPPTPTPTPTLPPTPTPTSAPREFTVCIEHSAWFADLSSFGPELTGIRIPTERFTTCIEHSAWFADLSAFGPELTGIRIPTERFTTCIEHSAWFADLSSFGIPTTGVRIPTEQFTSCIEHSAWFDDLSAFRVPGLTARIPIEQVGSCIKVFSIFGPASSFDTIPASGIPPVSETLNTCITLSGTIGDKTTVDVPPTTGFCIPTGICEPDKVSSCIELSSMFASRKIFGLPEMSSFKVEPDVVGACLELSGWAGDRSYVGLPETSSIKFEPDLAGACFELSSFFADRSGVGLPETTAIIFEPEPVEVCFSLSSWFGTRRTVGLPETSAVTVSSDTIGACFALSAQFPANSSEVPQTSAVKIPADQIKTCMLVEAFFDTEEGTPTPETSGMTIVPQRLETCLTVSASFSSQVPWEEFATVGYLFYASVSQIGASTGDYISLTDNSLYFRNWDSATSSYNFEDAFTFLSRRLSASDRIEEIGADVCSMRENLYLTFPQGSSQSSSYIGAFILQPLATGSVIKTAIDTENGNIYSVYPSEGTTDTTDPATPIKYGSIPYRMYRLLLPQSPGTKVTVQVNQCEPV